MITIINNNTIKINGRIDSNNAAEFEKQLLLAAGENYGDITLDAGELEYISSAGLRVLLKLKKSTKGKVSVINVSSDVYDIFNVTGFDNILDVKKAIREIDVTNCEIIGQGGNGTVYRLDDDTIVKVYRPNVSLAAIEKERAAAKTALVNGVPCVIAYDAVKCGESYGIVFEMLKSDTLGHAMKNNPDKFEEYVEKYVALAKELHNADIAEGSFRKIKDVLRSRVPNLAKWCTEEELKLIDSLIDEIPDGTALIHGDFHPGNIMIQDGELLLIDMPEVSMGAKIWDIAAIYRDMISAPQTTAVETANMLEGSIGMPKEMILKTGYRFFELYTGITDRNELEAYFKKLGLIYALNVVLVLGSGSKHAEEKAEGIIDYLLRKVLVPNEQALRYVLKS
ncbi:MAG: anti-sigma factor antagonist [Firmicutes bacterium]|nr:anti-sigma factor antagonist [Bacillota bacterium]